MTPRQGQPTAVEADEQHALLRARVSSPSQGVVVLKEPPVVTLHTMGVMWAQVNTLFGESSKRVLVADLSETGMPQAEIRAQLRMLMRQHALSHVAIVLGNNRIMQAAARFVVTMILNDLHSSVHGDLNEAIAWAQRV